MQNILIPFAYRRNSSEAIGPKHFVRETYITKLQKYGLLPLFVSSAMTQEAIDQKLAAADGVLVMGGLDIQSDHYTNDSPHAETEPSLVRDELELSLIKRAWKDRLPVLGICRGCQVMAVAAGGDLHQHLPDKEIEEQHGNSVSGEGYDHVVNVTHAVNIHKDTKLFDIIQRDQLVVNSGHHQAVKDPGDKLQPAATTPEGVIEAVEHEDKDYFCLGLQSHPEAQEDGPLEPVFQAFKDAVKIPE